MLRTILALSLRLALIVFAFTRACIAADCDFVFTTQATGRIAIINNKGKACYNWQLSYYSSGFSVVSVEMDSAVDAGTVAGSWSAFSATGNTNPVTGSNPSTATDQATATFIGAPAWVSLNITTTGTGTITGRIVGTALTASQFPQTYPPLIQTQWWAPFSPPSAANFTTQNNAGNTTRTTIASPPSLNAHINRSVGGVNLTVICDNTITLGSTFTLTGAFVMEPEQSTNADAYGGLSLGSTSTSKTENVKLFPGTSASGVGVVAGPLRYGCAWSDDTTGCTTVQFAGGGFLLSLLGQLIWQRVTDDGTTRCWQFSTDGVSWFDKSTTGANPPTCHASSDFTPNRACWGFRQNNGNYSGGLTLLSWKVTNP